MSWKRGITVVKSDGSLDFKIDLKPFAPFDITNIPNTNTIAVTSNSSNDIKIVDVNARGVLKTYCLDSPCAGITCKENSFILCSRENGILELNQHDGSIKTIVSLKMDNYSHVAISGDKIYYTHSQNHSVTCCDFQGQIQWTFRDRKIKFPIDVSVDNDGNVFVAGNHSNNVVVISQDGQQHKQLLSSMDGIEWPNGLIFDRDNNQKRRVFNPTKNCENSGYISNDLLLKKVIMSDSTALCGVCCLRHLSKPSTGWCLECEEGLCMDCKEHHSLLKATRNHTIIPITEYQKLPQNVLEITRNCKKHNEILQIFCKKHDSPCCRKCIIETHNNCTNLIEIEDYIKDIKSSARFQEVEEIMNETAENIKRIRINREKT
ncbi:unnamed protein product [Mytilus edulis]|uniref:B box-type domain-containing protein n=1 Tax=Mytilus edulis TaxID=6550 RepID=A0A8S3RLS7_MYTED|nr:unnamed protein product [Mytilus edulis]